MNTFKDAMADVERQKDELQKIWAEAYGLASKRIGGNWQEPEVMKRRREVAWIIVEELYTKHIKDKAAEYIQKATLDESFLNGSVLPNGRCDLCGAPEHEDVRDCPETK